MSSAIFNVCKQRGEKREMLIGMQCYGSRQIRLSQRFAQYFGMMMDPLVVG